MRHPPRLAHLATRAIVIQRLLPTYAKAHQIDEDEARSRLEQALKGPLLGQLLDATWNALKGGTKRLDDQGLLEKVAGKLKERPYRMGRTAELNADWSAFLLLIDLAAQTASDAARRVLETPDGMKRTERGIIEVGTFLAKELTRA